MRMLCVAATVAAMAFAGQARAQTEAGGNPGSFVVKPGTRVPLALINSVSTKQAAPGDRVYLESVFPVVVDGKIVIPPGTYVAGTVTQVKRPGRLKGRGELYVRFDSMILPNGVTRDFRARVGAIDGRAGEELDREEGKIKGEGNKSGDARTVGEAASGGATAGVIAGAVYGRPGMGVGLGAAAGATAGLIGVLLSRGPEAMLTKGTQLDMVLDRELSFTDAELQFPSTPQRIMVDTGSGPVSQRSGGGIPQLGRGPIP
jgi:type IV secretion system protein VirB10